MSVDSKIAELLEEAKKFKPEEKNTKVKQDELGTEGECRLTKEELDVFAAMSNEELEEFMQSEEYEELDETAKEILKDFANSTKDAVTKFTKGVKRGAGAAAVTALGIRPGMQKLRKEEQEYVDTIQAMTEDEFEAFMQTEEYEQLSDELKEMVIPPRYPRHNPRKPKFDYIPPSKKFGIGSDTHIKTVEDEQKKKQKDNMNQANEDHGIDISADVAALTEGEGLSEEFKTKAATIFEAAVISRVKQEYSRLEEEFDARLEEQVEAIKEGVIEKVDGYLDYVVEEWVTQNELALENGLKNEIFESFVSGMKNLFEQHYIDVPKERFDVVSELAEQVKETETKLSEQFSANVELKRQLVEMKRAIAVEKIAEGLADTDADKFKELAEELSFQSDESFEAKLQTIKESYFGKKTTKSETRAYTSPVTNSPILNEETESKSTTADPKMAAYLSVINKK